MREHVLAELFTDMHCSKSFFTFFYCKKQIKAFTCAGSKFAEFPLHINHANRDIFR